jgi:hypothetical protein
VSALTRGLLICVLGASACFGSPEPEVEAGAEAPAAEQEAAEKKKPNEAKNAKKQRKSKNGKALQDVSGQYVKLAQQLIVGLEKEKPSKSLMKLADELTVLGVKLVRKMKPDHPDCEEYFDAIIGVSKDLSKMSLEEIESGYHADGALPEVPEGACYHGKDLVVHPASVSAMARVTPDGWQADAKAEIVEVLEHLKAVVEK